jgi:hypothetical protein
LWEIVVLDAIYRCNRKQSDRKTPLCGSRRSSNWSRQSRF